MNIFKNIGSNIQSISNSSSVTMSNRNGKSIVTINGKTIQIPSGNVSVINNKIFVNGKEIDTDNTDLHNNNGTVNVIVEGNCDKIDCSGSVEVKGNISNGIDCGGSANITGNVDGDIDSGGSVKIIGEHKGNIDAGGSVLIR